MVLKYLDRALKSFLSVENVKQPNYTSPSGGSYYLEGQAKLLKAEKFLREEFGARGLMSEYEIIKEEDNDTEPRLFINRIIPEGKIRVFNVRYDPLRDSITSKDFKPILFYIDWVGQDPKVDDIIDKADKMLSKSLYE